MLIKSYNIDEDLNTEEKYDAHEVDNENNDEKHLAIVELNQKFKVFGDFTLFSTKVYDIYCLRGKMNKSFKLIDEVK